MLEVCFFVNGLVQYIKHKTYTFIYDINKVLVTFVGVLDDCSVGNQMSICVLQGELLRTFKSLVGLRQRDGLSKKTFNIALEVVFRRSQIETSGMIFSMSNSEY